MDFYSKKSPDCPKSVWTLNSDGLCLQRSLAEDKGVGPWLLALFIFVVCGSGESSSSLSPCSDWLCSDWLCSDWPFLDVECEVNFPLKGVV